VATREPCIRDQAAEQPTGSLGDLEEQGVLAHALEHVSEGREVIFMVTDANNQQWAHSFLINLHGLNIHHSLVIASAAEVCSSLHLRMTSSKITSYGGCAHSSYLRESGNATIAAGLQRWRIKDDHVFHLWWQRWRYVGFAVLRGYNTLSLDTDISLRADPYPLLRFAYPHRQLVVAIESEKPAKANHYVFPAVNLGFVYCRSRPNGTVQRLIADLTRRVEEHLLSNESIRNREGHVAINMLWEQDVFRDVVETFAFNIKPPSFRHALYHAGTSPSDLNEQAKTFDWRHEHTSFFEGRPSVETVWLQLHNPHTGEADETLAGLPLWFFTPFMIGPHGNAWNGGWVRHPSPVVVAHLVFGKSKLFVMRALGFWHYDASRPEPSAILTSTPSPRVFPEDVRVLAMRRHGLQLRSPDHSVVLSVWIELLRFTLLALALGRRAVLPFLACSNKRGPPDEGNVPLVLRGQMTVLALNNESLCTNQSSVAHIATTPTQLAVDPGNILLSPPRKRPPFDACCMLVPHSMKWVEPFGKRELRKEQMLNERDLARLLLEAGTSKPVSSIRVSEVERAFLKGARLPMLEINRRERVLYLDMEGSSTLAQLASAGGADTLLASACAKSSERYCEHLVRQITRLSSDLAERMKSG
tara:strand:+ start:307 stop:2235 length:1929 start_codon:yes stop_codon:yes gene_type:complete